MEIWKDIKGYEGFYQISNKGNVKSLRRDRERILKSEIGKRGYPYVVFSVGGKRKTFKIHRLVAENFVPNPNNFPQVNHKDENKTNNSVENLEWCTSEYNCNYGTRNSRLSSPVICIELNKTYNSIKEASKDLNIQQEKLTIKLLFFSTLITLHSF